MSINVSKKMICHVPFKKMGWKPAIFTGLIIAILFTVFCSIQLTAQGMYYDELHQATGSFYKDKAPLCPLVIRGIPVMNTSYSGAIKTNIYGIYLKYSKCNFSIISWRLLGIFFVVAGVILFCVIGGSDLSIGGLLLFLVLLLTDITVVLTTRHDWGPTALALLFRLVFIATWIHGETGNYTSKGNTFLLGSIVGISIFEKLSSFVLVVPLILILLLSHGRRSLRHGLTCIAGLILGVMPLILVNVATLSRKGCLISVSNVAAQNNFSLYGFVKYIFEYLSLGGGAILRHGILGTTGTTSFYADGFLIGTLLLLIAVIAVRYSKRNKFLRMSGIMLLCYGTVGISLYFLPQITWVHHWIIGTPFQYAAISFAFIGLLDQNGDIQLGRKFLRITLVCIIGCLLISRLFGMISVGKSLLQCDASIKWDHSLTEIGYFAARQSNDSFFIAADWGVGTQIYCLTNGQTDLVHELFWNYKGLADIERVIGITRKNNFYVVVKKPESGVNHHVTSRIMQDVELLAGWKEVPIEKEMAGLKAIQIRKFQKVVRD
ncbi:MAG: hypothetical protein CVU62_13150 [Deltaproteobacteria bacterium HGW-Deltaproteobacteria-2]|jgi:hypothetical protein|nr:MAG: hypothetical protein CVU62_13150 [Deltaproteobacteria bacterium HGW-Deltaproteobacteria-2]